jgi:hypothetical protein
MHIRSFRGDKIEKNELGGACIGERRGVYGVLVGKPEGKRQFWRPRLRCEDNIKRDLQEVGCRSMGWIELAQDRDSWRELLNVVMNIRNYKCGEFIFPLLHKLTIMHSNTYTK